jgi:hypothetical protein
MTPIILSTANIEYGRDCQSMRGEGFHKLISNQFISIHLLTYGAEYQASGSSSPFNIGPYYYNRIIIDAGHGYTTSHSPAIN